MCNDLAGDQVVTDPDPVMTESPIDSNHDTALEDEFPGIFPPCVVTRSVTKANKLDEHEINLSETFIATLDSLPVLSDENAPFKHEN